MPPLRKSPIFDRYQWLKLLQSPRTALALLAVAAIWIYFSPSKPADDGKNYVGRLRDEFQKISPPSGASAMGDLTVHTKHELALVQRRYVSQNPIEQVLRSYQQQLSSNGWAYSRRFKGGSDWGEFYCKGEFGASVEVRPAEGSFVYYFSMTWGGMTALDCSAKKQDG